MNILVIFAAGVTVGWVADKLYRRIRSPNNQANVDVEAAVVEDGKTGGQTGDDENRSKAKSKNTEKKGVKADAGHRDDLTQLKGVGPKLAGALDEIGIYNYVQLSGSSVDMLFEQLKEAGGRFTRSVIASIVEGAKQAAEEK